VSIGETLRVLLEERDISQKQLADMLGLGASTLGNYIQNTRAPDYDMLKVLATFFDVSTDYLLGHKANMEITDQEDELLRIFRTLTTEQRELFIEQGKLLIAHKYKVRNNS